jgi:CMP-N,N'-diacetyllegionaminic acid synthase
VRLLAGKPLVAHSIEQALSASLVKRTVVSTEDEEIGGVAQQYGAEVIWRPAELATDSATSESALLHVLNDLRSTERYEPDLVVFLQCTSPVRKPEDIDAAVELLVREQGDSLISVTPWHGFLWRLGEEGGYPVNFDYRQRPRRQQLPQEFRENGSIFVFKPSVLRASNNRLGGRVVLYAMSYWSAFEVDTEDDFSLCEWILRSPGGFLGRSG